MSGEVLATVAKCAGAALLVSALYGVYTVIKRRRDPRWWWNARRGGPTEVTSRADWENSLIHGFVAPGWERVKREFIENFRSRGDLGAAVCVYYRGEKVVDLWGGNRNRKGDEWEENTLVPIYSSTKGVSAFGLAIQASRGLIDFNEPVARYWPEFAAHGKGNVTVRQLVGHQVGLAGPSPPIDLKTLRDPKATRDFFANVKMEWEIPGDRKGYMAVTLGNYESALVQQTDAAGRTMGTFLREELFSKLGIEDEIYIGVPPSIPDERFATIDGMSGLEPLFVDSMPDGFVSRLLLQPNSYTGRAFANPRLSLMPGVLDYNRRDVKELEFPAANGNSTARAVAQIYAAAERVLNNPEPSPTDSECNASLTASAQSVGLTADALGEFTAPAEPARKTGWMDEILLIEIAMGAGMLKPGPTDTDADAPTDAPDGRFPVFGADSRAFGTPGAGGSFGFCDPATGIAMSYVMNRTGAYLLDDPREFALRVAVWRSARDAGEEALQDEAVFAKLCVPHRYAGRDMERFPYLAPLPE